MSTHPPMQGTAPPPRSWREFRGFSPEPAPRRRHRLRARVWSAGAVAVLLIAGAGPLPAAAPGPEERFREGTALLRSGDIPGGLAVFRELASSGHESVNLYWNWAQGAAVRGRAGEALWALLRAREVGPRDAAAEREIERLRLALQLDRAELNPVPTVALSRVARSWHFQLVAWVLFAFALHLRIFYWLWVWLVMLILLTGLLSGWIIGMSYSRISAYKLISGKIPGQNGSKRWNYSFLLLHFTIYMMLVTGLIAVSKQLEYTRSGYMGINPENVIVADLSSDELRNNFLALRDEIRNIPGVISVAGGSFIPPFEHFLPVNLADISGEIIRFDGLIMGEGMTELLGIEVIDGSPFGPYKEGTPEVLINESAAKLHNVKAGDNLLAFRVRGVLRDFHAHSMHSSIQPMVILPQNPARMGLLVIKTDWVNDEKIIKQFRDLYSRISPDEIFEVRYLTEQIDKFYLRERNQSHIIKAFSLLAMVLSVMGLFGISLISISKREKEIGIRKVNGALESEVLVMLNTAYIKWVLLAIVISVPVSYWLILKWMERFAYKTEISWWIFVLAALSAIIISILTVSWHSWWAATMNPVEALRYE